MKSGITVSLSLDQKGGFTLSPFLSARYDTRKDSPQMNSKLHTIIETAAFFTLTVVISSLTMLGAVGIDPFAPTNALSTTATEVN